MDDQWIYPSGSQASAADQLDALQRAQDALWVKLRREDDPERRMGLLAEFGANRDAIARLTKSVASGSAIDADVGTSAAGVSNDGDSRDEHGRDENSDGGDSRDRDDGAEDGAEDHGDDGRDRGADDGDGTADEPVWRVDQIDDESVPIKPLSFSDTGDLVVSDVAEPSLNTPMFMADASAGDDRGASDGAGVNAVDADSGVETTAIPGGDDDAAYPSDGRSNGSAPSIFGSAELADGSFDARDVPTSQQAAPSQEFGEALGSSTSGRPSSESESAQTSESESNERSRAMDQFGEPAEEDLAAYFLAEDSASNGNGSYRDGYEPAEPPDYQQPLPGLGRAEAAPYASPDDSDPMALRAQASSRAPAPTSQYPAIRPPREPARQRNAAESETESPRRALMLLAGLVAVLGISWVLLSGPGGEAPTSAASEPTGVTSAGEEVAGPTADAEVDEIMVGLSNMGLSTVGAERRGSVIFLTGVVPTAADRDVAIRVAQGVAVEQPINASELSTGQTTSQPTASAPDGRAATFQTELNRIVAATPLIFAVEQTSITDLHARILNSVASIMKSYPDIQVTIVGYTDNTGSDENNRAISLSRAESVKAYLVAQGLPEGSFVLDARGEDVATGSQALANLERRVEFEVTQPEGVAAATGAAPLRIAIVAPSARNDLAFTQSMVDAANVIAGERGNVDVAITDSTFVPEEASAAIRGYAAEGYDLVIAHGSQFGTALVEIAPEYPDVTFAWGTASDTFGLPNVYAYDAAAHQGGYVMGTMSTLLSTTGVVGVVGPIEVGDARLYVNGFRAGALSSKPDATVLVDYTGSFSDLTLAAETAQAQVSNGADVMTGSAQMVVGAVSVANENGTFWFGTQSNQTSLAPSLVVASQVYHWEVILRQIIGDIDGGSPTGKTYTADLANGGLVIEYNPDVVLPEAIRARADQVTAAIIDGSLQVPAG